MNSTKPKTIAFDLDDVLCHRDEKATGPQKYLTCKPIFEMISIVNKCYEEGMIIKIYTARGQCTFHGDVSKIYANLFELTTKHLREWGVKYHQLIMGKPHYDLLIDDKAMDSRDVKSLIDIEERLENA